MIAAEKNGEPVLAKVFWKQVEAQKDDKEAWLKENRKGFICAVCKAPATFVRPGTGERGRPTHFRVTGASQCNNHGPSGGAEPAAQGEPDVQEGILNVGGVVTVRYDGLGGAGGEDAEPGGTGNTDDGPTRVRYVDGGGAPNDQESAGLRALLSDLSSMPDFPPKELRLKVADRGEVWATEYFCRFEDATADHARPLPGTNQARLMAYWGEIDWANDSGSLFLNGKGMSVLVLPVDKPKLKIGLGVTAFKDLKAWKVIVEGRLEQNRTGGLHVRVFDLKKTAFIKP